MSLLQVSTVAFIGATVGVVCVVRALREGTRAGEIAYWSALAFGLCAAFSLWMMLLGGILGASDMFFWPNIQSRAGRSLLMLFGSLAGTLSALITAGIAVAVKGRGNA